MFEWQKNSFTTGGTPVVKENNGSTGRTALQFGGTEEVTTNALK